MWKRGINDYGRQQTQQKGQSWLKAPAATATQLATQGSWSSRR